MDSVRDLLSSRRPAFTTWTFGRRRYYSPLVHAVAARMEHQATTGAFAVPDPAARPAAEPAERDATVGGSAAAAGRQVSP